MRGKKEKLIIFISKEYTKSWVFVGYLLCLLVSITEIHTHCGERKTTSPVATSNHEHRFLVADRYVFLGSALLSKQRFVEVIKRMMAFLH